MVMSECVFLRQVVRVVFVLARARATRLTRGIRAQAMDADGSLVDDFRIERGSRTVHVRNAPSPGATSAMAIAEHVVDLLGLGD